MLDPDPSTADLTVPDISTVIPTYRRPAELHQAIASVLGQPGVRVEVVVVDDCPDGTAEPVAAAFADPRVRYLRNPVPSRGRPALVRNLGLSRARGGLVHFLDDDDLVPAGYYRTARDYFAAHPRANVLFGRVEPFGRAAEGVAHEIDFFAKAARRARRCRWMGGRWAFCAAMVFRPTLLVCGAALLRRSCLPALDGFDGGLALMEDVDFYARAIRRWGVSYIDQVSLHYRIGPSLMHRPGRQPAVDESYLRMHRQYRARHGIAEFLLLKTFARATRL